MTESYRAVQMVRRADSFRAGCRIAELPLLDPGPGEIRVRNHWAGVNGIFDTQLVQGSVSYLRIDPPTLTGVESVGVVEAVGDGVAEFAVGDAVGSTRFRGGYREAKTGPASDFVPVPDASRESLALVSSAVAALVALEQAAQVKAGETVAISAAAGGLGQFYVQLAKAKGARVIGICGGADKAAFITRLGADRAIDYRQEDIAAVLAAEFPDAIDVAIDTVGRELFDAFVDNLAPHGRLVISGFAADMAEAAEIVAAPRVYHKLYYKGASIRAFQNGLMTQYWPDARARLFAMHAAGALTVAFDGTPFVGIEAAFDAVEHLVSGRSTGKVVLDLRG